MSIPAFSRIQSQDDVLNRVQQNLSRSLNPIVQLPQTQGQILQNVILASGTNIIEHKLGRTLLGWYPVRMRGNFVQLYDQQVTNVTPAVTLMLYASVAGDIDLYVF
jgi:hypothetical protein